MFKELKQQFVFLLIIFFFYGPAYYLIPFLTTDDLLVKAPYVNNVLIYSPLITLLLSLIYTAIYGYSWRFLAWVALLFLVTIFTFNEWILPYHIAYLLFTLLGSVIGSILYRLRKWLQRRKTQTDKTSRHEGS